MLALNPVKALAHQDLMDMFDQLQTRMKYRALSAPGLVIGSTSGQKVKIANTVTYVHNGVFKSKTTAEVAFTATTHDITNDADTVQEAVYLLSLDASGTPTLTMGAIASGAGAALLPEIPSGKTPIGYVRIAVAAGATPFNASTDLLSASHLTVSYVDLGWLSERFDAAQ